jgi:hypothetical protein
MAEGRLGADEEIKQFSKTFIVDEVLVKKYVDHLKYLEINKKKRAEKRQLKMQQERNKKYEDYNWIAMFNDGLLMKLNVSELNKYLSHHGMMHSLKLRKAEKIRVIQGHIASHLNVSEDDVSVEENSDDSYRDSSSSADESSEDIVLNDTLASLSESETEKTGDESETEDNVEDMFTTTRSGRVTTNWRVSKYR